MYRKPNYIFPKDFKIDLNQVVTQKLEAVEETVEDMKKKIEELQQKIKAKLGGK